MKSDIFTGNYLFHLHTTYTDAVITIQQYFEFAIKVGIEKLIFLEHIRRLPSYSVDSFRSKIKSFSDEYGISSFVGFEAKLLPSGDLDISKEHFEVADVIGIAEHGFMPDLTVLRKSLQRAINICQPHTKSKEIVWLHPGLTLKKCNLLLAENNLYIDMLLYATERGIKIERNLKHDLISRKEISKIDINYIVIGVDAHYMADLEVWSKLMNMKTIISEY